jgi:hypothetical protein
VTATYRMLIVLSFVVASPALASEDDMSWGDLKFRFVYDGKSPERAKVDIAHDKFICGKFDVRDESLIVDKDGGLANVLVWLDAKAAAPKVHPDYAKSAEAKITLDSRDCRFAPHVLTLRTTQTLALLNSDPIAHNARFDAMFNDSFNLLLPADRTIDHRLPKPERLPAKINCSIHPWRSAFVLIQDHPYMAVSDSHGQVEMSNLPVGKLSFVVWHERAGYLRTVDQGGNRVEWPKGRVEMEILPGKNDLGEIKLSPDLFIDR